MSQTVMSGSDDNTLMSVVIDTALAHLIHTVTNSARLATN
ncbi:hypothetical protein [Halorubrum distributum]